MLEIVKDIVVPLAAPLVAIVTLILFARNERKKYQVEAEHKVHARAAAIRRDVEMLLEAFGLLVRLREISGEIDAKRISVLQDASSRLFKHIYTDSLVYEKYFDRTKIPLLLSELEIRMQDLGEAGEIDPFLYFGFTRLGSLVETDSKKKAGYDSVCAEFLNSKPELYSLFMK